MERTKFSIGIQYDPTEEPLSIFQSTLNVLLHGEEPDNLIALYCLYYYTAKYQKTDIPIATTTYVSASLHWNPDKVRRIKKQLAELKLIEDFIKYGNNGRVESHHIKVNLTTNVKNHPAEITQGHILYNIQKKGSVIPPSLEWITDYCIERKNNVDPETFFNFYQSKGWMIGKNRMKNWQAAIHTWEKNSKNEKTSQTYGKKPYIIDDGIKYTISPDGRYRNSGGELYIE